MSSNGGSYPPPVSINVMFLWNGNQLYGASSNKDVGFSNIIGFANQLKSSVDAIKKKAQIISRIQTMFYFFFPLMWHILLLQEYL